MTNLLKVEWFKMRKYKAFWWIIGTTALSYPGVNYMVYKGYENEVRDPGRAAQVLKMLVGNPFTFPEVWHTVAYLSSIFIFIPAVVVIMLITNEYSFKTHRQNIIDGWSRGQFITSKLADIFILTAIITFLYTAVSFLIGLKNQDRLIWHTWEQSYYIGLFAFQTFSQLSIAFLIGFLVRKAFLALGIFLFYSLVVENIAVALLKHYQHDEGRFLPFEISDRMIPVPAFLGKLDPEAYKRSLAAVNQHIFLTLILTVLIWVICYWIHRKRDLR
jgi:ABC-2 type transport system permease protein